MKKSKIIIQQPKSLKSRSIINIKSANTEHPKTSHKLSKTVWQGRKFYQVAGAGKSSNCPLYSETRKSGNFLDKKMQK